MADIEIVSFEVKDHIDYLLSILENPNISEKLKETIEESIISILHFNYINPVYKVVSHDS